MASITLNHVVSYRTLWGNYADGTNSFDYVDIRLRRPEDYTERSKRVRPSCKFLSICPLIRLQRALAVRDYASLAAKAIFNKSFRDELKARARLAVHDDVPALPEQAEPGPSAEAGADTKTLKLQRTKELVRFSPILLSLSLIVSSTSSQITKSSTSSVDHYGASCMRYIDLRSARNRMQRAPETSSTSPKTAFSSGITSRMPML